MDLYIDAQNVVHTSPAAALGDRGHTLKSLDTAPPISSRAGWSRCGTCRAHFHEDQIASHMWRCESPVPAKPQKRVRSAAKTERQFISFSQRSAKPKVKQTPCPSCGAMVNPENMARHDRRIHLRVSGVDSASARQARPLAPKGSLSNSELVAQRRRAVAKIQQMMRESRHGTIGAPIGPSTPVYRVASETGRSLPPPSDATDPLRLRENCKHCSGFDVATALGIAWFHTLGHSQKKYEAKLSLVDDARHKGLLPCLYCASFVGDHRLAGHIRKQHGNLHVSRSVSAGRHDRTVAGRDRRPIHRVSLSVPNGSEAEDEHDDFQSGLGADVRGQARRHYLDASSDGRYSRDQGRFGSHPTHDGYGDEHWS
jgi:hypothetical protein